VISGPIGDAAGIGFVLCPSFGPEHTQLNGLEVVAARALASAGFPVLRYQSQGYGDSEGPRDAITPATHLADAADAVDVLRARIGDLPVGVLGGLFGGAIALLTAERLGLPAVAMWEPVVDGTRYAERILRNLAIQEMAVARNQDRARPPLTELRERLRSGALDAQGFLLTSRAYDELTSMPLLNDVAYHGASLVLSVSRSGRPTPGAAALHERLQRSGGAATLSTVRDRLVHPLGSYRFIGFNDRPGRLDTHFALNGRVADETAAWARELEIG
jgi:alpha/beta superfamily hydrolase